MTADPEQNARPIEWSTDESAFLQSPRHAIVATNRPEKSPQISPVWYWFEDGIFYISLRDDTAKYYNLQRDPNLSICIDAGRGDSRCVIVHGVAELFANGHPLQNEMRLRIIRHYHEDETAAQRYFDATNDGHPVLIRVAPTRKITLNI